MSEKDEDEEDCFGVLWNQKKECKYCKRGMKCREQYMKEEQPWRR